MFFISIYCNYTTISLGFAKLSWYIKSYRCVIFLPIWLIFFPSVVICITFRAIIAFFILRITSLAFIGTYDLSRYRIIIIRFFPKMFGMFIPRTVCTSSCPYYTMFRPSSSVITTSSLLGSIFRGFTQTFWQNCFINFPPDNDSIR